MKGLIITHKGFEDIAAKEAEELAGCEAETEDSVAILHAKNLLDLCLLSYKAQSAIKVMSLLAKTQATQDIAETASNLNRAIADTDLSPWFSENTTFKVVCARTGTHRFTSQDIMLEAAKTIKDKTNRDISLDNPDITFYIYVAESTIYFGVDLAGMDLSKRDYRIFAHPAALKGTIAYCLTRLAEYKRTDTLLDPFTKSGIIPIEAALYATKTPVNHYRKDALAFRTLKPLENEDFDSFFKKIDREMNTGSKTSIYSIDSSMPSITAAQKNAKLAGVVKKITFSRIELEWLDTKFSEGEIDKIVTSPPEESSRLHSRFVEKLYKELFYQAKYALSVKGTMTCILRNPELLKKVAQLNGFTAEHERAVSLGKEQLKAIRLIRS
ncbi:hypothetical protein HY640_03625 [Candidatus Woesearchaeota archaeon]|nr:hypothetical protein [Candidatus Woesearchaeota archaeon]